MKVALEIPKEFEQDFQSDRFNCFFGRVSAEISSNLKEGQVVLCGNYERERKEKTVKRTVTADHSQEL